MAAVTASAPPAVDRGLGDAVPARTAGPAAADRSPATVRPSRTVRSWPLRPRPRYGPAGSASPRRPASGGSPRCPVSGPRCTWTPASPSGRRGGLRGVHAARLAGQRVCGQREVPPVRQVVRDLLLRARDGRAGCLSPAGPTRSGAGAVARHHDRVLPARPGPGHGDRAGPHDARRRQHRSRAAGQPNPRTGGNASVLCLVLQGPGRTGPGPGRTPGTAGRVRSFRRDQNGPEAGPRRQGGNTHPVRDRPGAPGRRQAYRSGKAGIQTYPAQRGNQGLQPGPERPGGHDQRRTGRRSSAPTSPGNAAALSCTGTSAASRPGRRHYQARCQRPATTCC